MKNVIIIFIILIVLPSTVHAVKARPAKPYVVPTAVPTEIGKAIYVTGYPSLDDDKYARRIRYRGQFELGEHEVAFRRTRMRQDGKKGVEDIDILRFRYSDIEKLYYGKDAVKEISRGALPTAKKEVFDSDLGLFVSLERYVQRRTQSPVIIFYKHEGSTISLVVLASHAKARALYQLLSQQSNK